jgi:uracil-DNA glycosylase
MLRALRLHTATVPVHLVRVHRGSTLPGDGAAPRPFDDIFAPACAGLAPRLVLALGPLAAQALLGSAEPIGKLRGALRALPDGTPVLATYPLAHLLRQAAGKGKAWADLCLAAAAFERPAA